MASIDAQDAAGPAGDLCDGVVTEMLDDLVEGRGDGRQCGELADEGFAARDRFLAEDGVTVLVEDGPGVEVAVVVGELLLQLDREGVGQELDDGLARGEVDREVVPFGGGDLGDAAVHERFAGGDELDDG